MGGVGVFPPHPPPLRAPLSTVEPWVALCVAGIPAPVLWLCATSSHPIPAPGRATGTAPVLHSSTPWLREIALRSALPTPYQPCVSRLCPVSPYGAWGWGSSRAGSHLVQTGSFWDALGCIEMHWDAPGYTGMGCTGMLYQRAEATAGSPWLHSDALGCTGMRWDGWCWGSLKIYQRTEAVPGSFWDALG